MSRVLLDNAQWNFGTNCFVCEPKNERGLGIPFYRDEDEGVVVAEFTPEVHHSGAPTFAHGGVSMALLDEAMSWATITLARRFAVTIHADVSFERMVKVGSAHTVRGWIASDDGEQLVARAELRDTKDRVCVAMTGQFQVLTQEQANRAVGSQAPAEYTSREGP